METVSQLLTLEPRPLHLVLGRAFANLKAGRDEQRLALCNRLFMTLNPVQQSLCRLEIAEVRAAKRGELEAVVS